MIRRSEIPFLSGFQSIESGSLYRILQSPRRLIPNRLIAIAGSPQNQEIVKQEKVKRTLAPFLEIYHPLLILTFSPLLKIYNI